MTNFCPGDSGGPITLELEMQLRIFNVLEKEKKVPVVAFFFDTYSKVHVQIGIGSIAGHKCGEDEAGYFDFPQKILKVFF